MVVYEKLIINTAGAFAMSTPHPGLDPREYRGKPGLYAKFFANSGDELDLFESATLQESKTRSYIRKLPERVFGGDDGRTIFVFRVGNALAAGGLQLMVGVLNVITGEIVLEQAYKVGGSIFGALTGSPPIGSSRPIACSCDGSMALFCMPHKGVFAVELKKGLPYVFKPQYPNADYDFAIATPSAWIICTESLYRRTIGVLELTTGKLIREIELKKTVTSFDVARDSNKLAIGFMGGAVNILDLNTYELQAYAPNRGADRNDWATVRITDDGRYLLSKMGCGKTLVLTDTRTGRAIPWLELEHHMVPTPIGDNHVFVQDFQFTDNQLVVVSNAALARHDIPKVNETDGFISQTNHPDFKKPPKYNKKKTLRENLEKFELSRVADQITDYWSPAYAIKLKRAGKKTPAIGASKLGGQPDLPDQQSWPVHNNIAMAFMAQINLEEVAAVEKHAWLPDNGLLSIFISVGEDPFPLGNANDKGAWKVVYTPAGTPLHRIATPEVPEYAAMFMQTEEAHINFKRGGRSLPAEDSLLVHALHLSDEEKQNYIELIQQVNKEFADDQPAHQFMGYPTELQGNDMEACCALASAGKDPYKHVLPKDSNYDQFLAESACWAMLLQLDSDETNSDMGWGDAGLYYWFMLREDLKQGQYNNVWGQLQCH